MVALLNPTGKECLEVRIALVGGAGAFIAKHHDNGMRLANT